MCPISCVIVWAKVIPLSSFTLQLFSLWHIPPTWATPRVLQGMFFLAHMSWRVTNIATSWWCGSFSFFGFKFCCHLQKSFRIISALTLEAKSWSEISSCNIIFTTTTFTRLPMLGSRYKDDTCERYGRFISSKYETDYAGLSIK